MAKMTNADGNAAMTNTDGDVRGENINGGETAKFVSVDVMYERKAIERQVKILPTNRQTGHQLNLA